MSIPVVCPTDGRIKRFPRLKRIIMEWDSYTEATEQVKEFLDLLGEKGCLALGDLTWQRL